MKRESLITKLVAFMLCVMMVVGCLPVSAFAAENDWEGDIDIVETEPPLGSESNPIDLTSEWVWNEANTEATVTVTVPAGNTIYYLSYNVGGMTMTIGDGDPVVCSGNPRTPYVWSIANDGEAEADYVITIAYPVGSMENPAEAYLGENTATIEAGSQGYYFTYTAWCDSKLVMTIAAEADAGWTYTINNVTAGTYGDTQWSDSDPVVNPATIELAAGDKIQIIVNTYDPADMWNTPAGTITVNLEQVLGICADCPIILQEQENTVTNVGTVYYGGYFSGTVMTVSGEGDFNVIYNGETIAAVDGVVSTSVSSSNPRMPVVFAIEGDGEYSVSFAYPAGSQMNPAVAVLGDNTSSIEAGNTQGYYWTYTAEQDGNLIVTISADAGWTYVINNLTVGTYGDTQWSDSDPVVNPASIAVTAGDEIQIIVNTYDPADMWSNPAGDIIVNLAYEVTGPEVDESLKFYQVGLSFAEYIGVQPMMLTSVVKNYDSYYVEAVLTREDGTETIVLEPTLSTSSYNVYDVQMLPRAMTDGVTLTIYAVKDGVTYCSNPVNTSITALAIEKIGTYLAKDDLGACTVLVDMLNYGTEVQKAFDYKTDDVPSNYLGEYAVYGTTGDIAIEGAVSTSGSGIRVYANSLSLGSKVEVQFMFKTSAVEGCELRYTLNGETIAVPASEFDTTVMSGYSVAIFAMKPRNFRDTMTIAVYDATGAVISAVYTASIEDYAAGAITKYPTLVPAMMAYGDAVLARFPG